MYGVRARLKLKLRSPNFVNISSSSSLARPYKTYPGPNKNTYPYRTSAQMRWTYLAVIDMLYLAYLLGVHGHASTLQ